MALRKSDFGNKSPLTDWAFRHHLTFDDEVATEQLTAVVMSRSYHTKIRKYPNSLNGQNRLAILQAITPALKRGLAGETTLPRNKLIFYAPQIIFYH